jgi:Bacteriophage translational regulator
MSELNKEGYVDWNPSLMIEVTLDEPDTFLVVKETLQRVGISSKHEKKLYQSAHILHKSGKYYIISYKELFALDGKYCTLTEDDVRRRNRIAKLLSDWGLINIVRPEQIEDMAPLSLIKVLTYKERQDYELVSKYTIGGKKKTSKAETPTE